MSQALGDIAVHVRVAVKYDAPEAAPSSEKPELERGDPRVGRAAKLQHGYGAAGPEHAVNLFERHAEIGRISQGIAAGHDVELGRLQRQPSHIRLNEAPVCRARAPQPSPGRSEHPAVHIDAGHRPAEEPARETKRQITGSAGKIERAHVVRPWEVPNQMPLPALVLAKGEQAGRKIVARRDDAEQPAVVAQLAVRVAQIVFAQALAGGRVVRAFGHSSRMTVLLKHGQGNSGLCA